MDPELVAQDASEKKTKRTRGRKPTGKGAVADAAVDETKNDSDGQDSKSPAPSPVVAKPETATRKSKRGLKRIHHDHAEYVDSQENADGQSSEDLDTTAKPRGRGRPKRTRTSDAAQGNGKSKKQKT